MAEEGPDQQLVYQVATILAPTVADGLLEELKKGAPPPSEEGGAGMSGWVGCCDPGMSGWVGC